FEAGGGKDDVRTGEEPMRQRLRVSDVNRDSPRIILGDRDEGGLDRFVAVADKCQLGALAHNLTHALCDSVRHFLLGYAAHYSEERVRTRVETEFALLVGLAGSLAVKVVRVVRL